MVVKRKLENRGRIIMPIVIRDKLRLDKEGGVIFEVKNNNEVYIRAG